MIEFEKKYSMKNGNKLTKKNWHKVVALASEPNTTNLGWPIIEAEKIKSGAYYNTWKLKYENNDPERTGYIFREINHNGGIDGHHKTAKEAVWFAMRRGIRVYLEE